MAELGRDRSHGKDDGWPVPSLHLQVRLTAFIGGLDNYWVYAYHDFGR